MFQVVNLMQSVTLEVFFHPPPASLQGYDLHNDGNSVLQFGRVTHHSVSHRQMGCPRSTTAVPRPFLLSSMLKKEEMKQSFCGLMPLQSPASSNHSLDLILSLTTKTPEQGRDATPTPVPL